MKKHLLKSVVLFGVLAIAAQAYALEITPISGVLNTSRWEGDQTSQAEINAFIATYLGSATELYKQDVGGGESGLLAGNYETTFSNTADDPANALIQHTGEASVDDPAFLLVKDGGHSPAWYLFDLTALGWNGTDDLVLSGFWPNQGAISHVTLYGTPQGVPEPGAMLLLGIGLVGLAGWGRKRIKK